MRKEGPLLNRRLFKKGPFLTSGNARGSARLHVPTHTSTHRPMQFFTEGFLL